MTLGTTAGEIVRVLQKAKRPMTATEIQEAGSFETPYAANNGLAQLVKMRDSPVCRAKETGIGKFVYTLLPDADLTSILNDSATDLAEARAEQPNVRVHRMEDDEPDAVGKIIARHNHVVHMQPVVTREAPAVKVEQQPTAQVEPSPEPPHEREKINQSQPALVAFKGENVDEDPIDVCIDTLLIGLVLRLPVDGCEWTKAQRRAWQVTFDCVVDFLFPASK